MLKQKEENLEIENTCQEILEQNSIIYYQKIKAFREIFYLEKNEKASKKKFSNREATDEMNIFQCPFPDCKRNYFNLKDWGVHYRYHVNREKYKCHLCSKSFNMRNNLNVHMRSHTKERPFKCPRKNCGKVFATKGNMKKHKDFHCDGQREENEKNPREKIQQEIIHQEIIQKESI